MNYDPEKMARSPLELFQSELLNNEKLVEHFDGKCQNEMIKSSTNQMLLDSSFLITYFENHLSTLLDAKRSEVGQDVPNLTVFTLSYAKAFYASTVAKLQTHFNNNLAEEDWKKMCENAMEEAAHNYVDRLVSQLAGRGEWRWQLDQLDEKVVSVTHGSECTPSLASNGKLLVNGSNIKGTKVSPPTVELDFQTPDVKQNYKELPSSTTGATGDDSTFDKSRILFPIHQKKLSKKKRLEDSSTTPASPKQNFVTTNRIGNRNKHHGKKKLNFTMQSFEEEQIDDFAVILAVPPPEKLSKVDFSQQGQNPQSLKKVDYLPNTSKALLNFTQSTFEDLSPLVLEENSSLPAFEANQTLRDSDSEARSRSQNGIVCLKTHSTFPNDAALNEKRTLERTPSKYEASTQTTLQNLPNRRLIFSSSQENPSFGSLKETRADNLRSVFRSGEDGSSTFKSISSPSFLSADGCDIRHYDKLASFGTPTAIHEELSTKNFSSKLSECERKLKSSENHVTASKKGISSHAYQLKIFEDLLGMQQKALTDEEHLNSWSPLPFIPTHSLGAPMKKKVTFPKRYSPKCRLNLVSRFRDIELVSRSMDTPPESPDW